MNVRALIIDDERIARASLRELLDDVDWVSCVGEAVNGDEALEMIDRLRPDLVFLDIHMPGCDGIEVLRRIEYLPHVVITTAHDHYAVEAFDLQATDYLLKPFGRRRLEQALARIRQSLATHGDPRFLRRLFVRERGRIVPLLVETIEWFESEGDYVRVHACGRTYLTSTRLKELEASLDPERFVRVHRSCIVNLDFVTSLRPVPGSRMVIELEGGCEVEASRRFTPRLRLRVSSSV